MPDTGATRRYYQHVNSFSARFAFATTSYRQNGLAVLEGLEDVTQLVAAFVLYD